MKKILLSLFVVGGLGTFVGCSNDENNNPPNNSSISSSEENRASTKSTVKLYPDNADEWHLGKVDIPGFISSSNKDLASALDDLSLIADLSLSSYFSTPSSPAEIKISVAESDSNFYTFTVTNLNIPDKISMETYEKNIRTLIAQQPTNPNIDLYIFTGLYSTSANVDDKKTLTISYILNEDGTLSEVGSTENK